MNPSDNLESKIPKRLLFTVRCVVVLLLPPLLLWSILLMPVFTLRLFVLLWCSAWDIARGLTPEPPEIIPDWVFVPQSIFYKGWRHAFLADDELQLRYGSPQSTGPRSVSDDDLCSACRHCKHISTGVTQIEDELGLHLSDCTQGWPGQPDPAAYIRSCKAFKPRN